MDKIKFVKASEMYEDDKSANSAPAVRRLSVRMRTVGNRSCRCGFYFYRNFLIGLNVLYLLISVSLLMLAIAARAIMYLNSIPVLGGVAAAAAILFLIAIIGLFAIIKQNQIILFFFMVTLGFTSALCFCLSVACMALPAHGQYEVLLNVWGSTAPSGRSTIQNTLNCCAFNSDNRSTNDPPCYSRDGYTGPGGNSTSAYALPLSMDGQSILYTESCPSCHSCYPLWEHAIASALYAAGVIGFIFTLSQALGILMVYRYRHLRNPAVNPYRNFL